MYTETDFLCNSSETTQQNFVKLCIYKHIWRKFWFFIFLAVTGMPLLNLEILQKIKWNFVVMFILRTYCVHVHIYRIFSFYFFLREQIELWPRYTSYFMQLVWSGFSMNNRAAVHSDIFLPVNIQMLHKCDNYQLSISDYYQYSIMIFCPIANE